MKKHFVTFMSPGTFCSESTTKEIDSWDVDTAIIMSKSITERHSSRPYAFYFTTKERGEEDFDSKETKRSNLYYLGGTVQTLEEVIAEKNSNNDILISNMKCNNWKRVVTTYSPWRWTQPLEEDDIVLNMEGK